jgi:hypothetical protein
MFTSTTPPAVCTRWGRWGCWLDEMLDCAAGDLAAYSVGRNAKISKFFSRDGELTQIIFKLRVV